MKRNIHAGRRNAGGIDFRVLTEEDKARIHASTLEVLMKTGVFVEDEEALEIYAGQGCTIEPKAKIVKIPSHLVEDAIRSAPEVVLMAGRRPEDDFLMEMNRVSFSCFGTAITIMDPKTRKIRPSTKVDLAECARVIDSLDQVETNRRSVSAYDVPQEVAAVHDAEALLLNTTKHILTTPYNGYMAQQIIKMLVAIVGSEEELRQRPLVTFNNCAVTPLKLPRECCEIIMVSARAGLMVTVLSQALTGGSSPITLAGTLVIHNAEVLAGLVLSQLVAKGNPFLYASSTCSLDMRHGTAAVGTPETALLNAGIAEMARYYLLPCRVAGG
jgi:trimethylamine---corrinoid protein Co-methyltransferase